MNYLFYRADGGVCNNDFLMQLMADITYQHIDRARQRGDMTSLGTAFLAGLAKGMKSFICSLSIVSFDLTD